MEMEQIIKNLIMNGELKGKNEGWKIGYTTYFITMDNNSSFEIDVNEIDKEVRFYHIWDKSVNLSNIYNLIVKFNSLGYKIA